LSLRRIDGETVLRWHTFEGRLPSRRESRARIERIGAGHLCRRTRSRFRSSAAFINSRRKGDAGLRPGGALWRADKIAQPRGKTKHGAISERFYVSAYAGRSRRFEVSNWHLK